MNMLSAYDLSTFWIPLANGNAFPIVSTDASTSINITITNRIDAAKTAAHRIRNF